MNSLWRWLLSKLRRHSCRHVFVGWQIGRRDESGFLDWPCSKCDFVARVDYGLQVSRFGTISGPWGGKPKEEQETPHE